MPLPFNWIKRKSNTNFTATPVDIDDPDAIAEAVKSLTARIARDHCPDFQQAEPLRNNIQDLLAALR
jgi:hypothetical protein